MPASRKTTKEPSKSLKRSGVKEMVNALYDLGVSKDDIVIDRAPDGSIRVYKRGPVERAKMTDLDRWKAEHAKFA